MPKYVLNYQFQPEDHRDFTYYAPRHLMAAQPPSFFLETPSVDDQGSLGSCYAQAIDALVKYDEKIQGRVVTQTSRLFTYYIARMLMGTTEQDSGSNNRLGLKALSQYGYLIPESLWPYDLPFNRKPSAACFAAALPNALKDYANVPQTLPQMKATLLAGRPFLYGFTCYPQLESQEAAQTGKIAMPSGRPIGGHDVAIFGYDDTVQCPGANPGSFKFLNSWGEGWGEKGCGWMPYDYATDPNQAGDFWVINSLPGGDTPVPPTPPTPPTPPGPPAPGPTKAFTLNFPYDIHKGQHTMITFGVNIPRGRYDAFPSTTAMAGASINWAAILATVQSLIKQYGPMAIPFINSYIDGLNLPPAAKTIIEGLVAGLLSAVNTAE